MRTTTALIFALPLSFSVSAQDLEQIYNSRSVAIEAKVSSSAEIVSRPDSTIDYVQAELYLFPKNEASQTVESITTIPKAEQISDGSRFFWSRPQQKLLNYELIMNIVTKNSFNKVRQKISFPIKSLPAEYSKYLKPTEHIDSDNPAIVAKASELAEGEDDLYIAVSKLAIWTKNNIVYNLSTLTAEVSQKASWVLQNKYGVCDELTSLFIAMLRSLGVPARFISGISFTNSPLFPEQWGAHGWAEVYFPGSGWIPFDPTFGEFGWIDPGHIKLKESLDPTEPSVKFEWKGRNVDLRAGKIEVDAEVKDFTETAESSIELKVSPVKEEVGFGSYNLIEAEVENLKDYYVTTELIMALVNELEIIGDNKQQAILKPFESKKIYWKVLVEKNLEEGYVYDVPIYVYTLKKEEDKKFFKTSEFGPVYSLKDVDRLFKVLEQQETKAPSSEMELSCSAEKQQFYSYESNKISCAIRNKGNTVIRELEVCLESDCRTASIGINQEKLVELELELNGFGEREVDVIAGNKDFSQTAKVSVEMLDPPEIGITELNFPESVSYADSFAVKFVVKKKSYSKPKNVLVSLSKNSEAREFEVEELKEEHEFVVDLAGKELRTGENYFAVVIDYYDGNGRAYSESKEFVIVLNKPTFLQRVAIFFSSIFGFLF